MRSLVVVIVALLGLGVGFHLGRSAEHPKPASAELPLAPVDVGYLQWMAVHHDQAIALARLALRKDQPELAGLSMNILGNQLLEVGQMRALLRLAKQSLLPNRQNMAWMEAVEDPAFAVYLSICSSSPGGMQGMYTRQDIEQLRGLEDEAFYLRYVHMMIEHHKGGMPMSAFARKYAQHPEVKSLAARILREQRLEIGNMMKLLLARESAKDA